MTNGKYNLTFAITFGDGLPVIFHAKQTGIYQVLLATISPLYHSLSLTHTHAHTHTPPHEQRLKALSGLRKDIHQEPSWS